MQSFYRKLAAECCVKRNWAKRNWVKRKWVKRNWVKQNRVQRLTWPRKWRKYGRPVDNKRTDRSPEKVSARCKGLLRDGAKRPRHNWQSAIRQALGRVRRGGSATGPIDPS